MPVVKRGGQCMVAETSVVVDQGWRRNIAQTRGVSGFVSVGRTIGARRQKSFATLSVEAAFDGAARPSLNTWRGAAVARDN
jgi:hypothetical protein